MLKHLLEQRFFRLLSEYSQRKVSVSEFAEAIEELAIHLADFSINEQNYSVLLRYFSFGLHWPEEIDIADMLIYKHRQSGSQCIILRPIMAQCLRGKTLQ